MFQTIINGFSWLITQAYHLTVSMGLPSYGFAIIMISILIKVVLFPLNHWQLKSMRRMQMIQPRLKELQERYANDRETFNRKTMELYQEYNVSPLGGCLPLLVQMPIFIAFYRALSTMEYEVIEHAGFFWIPNIAEKDPYYIICILAGLTTFLQQKISMGDSTDKTQRTMLYFMPLMMTWLATSLPAGLPLYWITFNILGIFQQIFVNKKFPDPRRAEAAAKIEAMVIEENNKTEKKGKKNKKGKGNDKEDVKDHAGSDRSN